MAPLFENDRAFFHQDCANAVFNRIREHEVDAMHRVGLVDAVPLADEVF